MSRHCLNPADPHCRKGCSGDSPCEYAAPPSAPPAAQPAPDDVQHRSSVDQGLPSLSVEASVADQLTDLLRETSTVLYMKTPLVDGRGVGYSQESDEAAVCAAYLALIEKLHNFLFGLKENAGDARDAARWRFLRSIVHLSYDEMPEAMRAGDPKTAEEADAMVDAAMRAATNAGTLSSESAP